MQEVVVTYVKECAFTDYGKPTEKCVITVIRQVETLTVRATNTDHQTFPPQRNSYCRLKLRCTEHRPTLVDSMSQHPRCTEYATLV
jgi:hypothetical protein